MNEDDGFVKADLTLTSIPPDIFEFPLTEFTETQERITNQAKTKFIDRAQDYNQPEATYRLYWGCQRPEKGVIEPRITQANDAIKRVTTALVLPYLTWDLPKSLFSWKARIRFINRWLHYYNRNADQYLRFVFFKPHRYCPFCQELRKLINNFLTNLKVDKVAADYFAKVIINQFEFDVQYKYPMQDWFSSTNKEEMLKRPVREILRVIKLFCKRDKNKERQDKLMQPMKLLAMAILFSPKIRKAWKDALKETNFSRLQMDEDDFYFCIIRLDYAYGGLYDDDKRFEIWKEIHHGNPPPMVEFKQQGHYANN